jgi:excisionase family DNA binding protein
VSASASLSEQIENLDRALTAPQLAKLLAVDRATVYRAAKSGALPSFRINSCVRFDPRAVARALRERGAR